ncbi:hypothetical protein [Gilvimarinus xylanilyticus]|uniref:Uncharacterized protein n=1 Tax=Gilvimarinus xylanilyticus TaxID=2944139 RepID=A0A9X2I2A6_9GAMM|nr:hypothetical protein [Gilvimarinus xylanilyticus]MCP8899483.1 hypothetical protein [Gilvimarinus xylanilyticus]
MDNSNESEPNKTHDLTAARDRAYQAQSRTLYWLKYAFTFALTAAVLGTLSGVLTAALYAPVEPFVVGVAVMILFHLFRVPERVERLLLRQYL